ncbi:queuosine precursor transporter [Salinarchaeum chitinilyticum]
MSADTSASRREAPVPTIGQVALIALFVTSLVTAQLTATKILAFDLPFSLPVVGAAITLPGAALAYAVTFLATDCYNELYGRRPTQLLVNVGFAMNFVLLALVWSTILAPAAGQGVPADQFETVLGAGTNVVIASLLAYVVSQNWDVLAFDWLRERTDGEHLWVRNIGSTASSQAIDTVIFVTVAFGILPRLLGIGGVLPWDLVLELIVGQYLLKLLIALVDTPFVYGIVAAIREQEAGEDSGGADALAWRS